MFHIIIIVKIGDFCMVIKYDDLTGGSPVNYRLKSMFYESQTYINLHGYRLNVSHVKFQSSVFDISYVKVLLKNRKNV